MLCVARSEIPQPSKFGLTWWPATYILATGANSTRVGQEGLRLVLVVVGVGRGATTQPTTVALSLPVPPCRLTVMLKQLLQKKRRPYSCRHSRRRDLMMTIMDSQDWTLLLLLLLSPAWSSRWQQGGGQQQQQQQVLRRLRLLRLIWRG